MSAFLFFMQDFKLNYSYATVHIFLQFLFKYQQCNKIQHQQNVYCIVSTTLANKYENKITG